MRERRRVAEHQAKNRYQLIRHCPDLIRQSMRPVSMDHRVKPRGNKKDNRAHQFLIDSFLFQIFL
jgi:hypothetical protein